MCGRFVQAQPLDVYASAFGVDIVKTESLKPSYNVAPTDPVYAVAEYHGDRILGSFRWGLVPWFSKDRKAAARHINARVETAAVKPSFRDSFAKRRCLIPADGFYEWEPKDKGKLPHYIYPADHEPMAFAGLWASWKDPESGEKLRTCTILTGEPNDLVQPIHDRMPVMLPRDVWSDWLDEDSVDTDQLTVLLATRSAVGLAEHAVSTLVNKVANNLPENIVPLETGAVDAS
ncbi:MAG: SOS response-associated peptidase [Acidimicrobiia bacterium]|nr:SOS response-associated peptidase [Acidimicrobiia bacterium]